MMHDTKLDNDIYDNDTFYFITFLTDRFMPLNVRWQHALELRFKKKFKPIHILSAAHNSLFKEDNFIVLNKDLEDLYQRYGRTDLIELIYPEELNRQFSESGQIDYLINNLTKKQGRVFVLSFSSVWLNISNQKVKILGPDPTVAAIFDDKKSHIETFNMLGLPTNKGIVYDNFKDLRIKHTVFPFFLSATFSSGGIESRVIDTVADLDEYYGSLRPVNRDKPFIAYEFVRDIVLAPNVTALISEDKVIVASISDQILRGNKYMGNTYPSIADSLHVDFMKNATNRIGRYLQTKGFRGLFGVDFIITKQGDCMPIDLNPRRQGGYYCFAMSSPIDVIDLEIRVVLGETLPPLDYEKFQCSYSWAHSKLSPYYSNVRIKEQYSLGSPVGPFQSIGSAYKAIYYPKDYTLMHGNPGFFLKTGNSRDELMYNLYEDIEETISAAYEVIE